MTTSVWLKRKPFAILKAGDGTDSGKLSLQAPERRSPAKEDKPSGFWATEDAGGPADIASFVVWGLGLPPGDSVAVTIGYDNPISVTEMPVVWSIDRVKVSWVSGKDGTQPTVHHFPKIGSVFQTKDLNGVQWNKVTFENEVAFDESSIITGGLLGGGVSTFAIKLVWKICRVLAIQMMGEHSRTAEALRGVRQFDPRRRIVIVLVNTALRHLARGLHVPDRVRPPFHTPASPSMLRPARAADVVAALCRISKKST